MSFDTLRHPPGKRIGVITAYQRAMLSQLHPAMLALAFLPVAVFAVLWGIAFWAGWAYWIAGFEKGVAWLPWAGSWATPAPGEGPGWFATTIAVILAIVIYAMLVLASALTFVSTFGMPLMLRHVAKDYPGLEMRRGGSFTGSLSNALWAVFWFVVFTVVTLPLWFVPLLGWILPIVLVGLLNARVLRYDALADHASAEEMALLMRAPGLYWRVLGVGGALINVVPVLWFISTTLTGLAFLHYALAALAAHRTTFNGKTEA